MKKVVVACIVFCLAIFTILELNGIVEVTGFIADDKASMNHDEIVKTVRTALLNHETKLNVKYTGRRENVTEYAKNIIREAMEIDDKSRIDDFDYIKHVYRGFSAQIKGFAIFFTIEYEFTYSETKKETEWVCERVKEIVSDMKLENKTTYEKIKIIHDYIINNTSYDLTVKNNTAYEALQTNATACQGYTNLAYIMLTEAGVNNRIITGFADKEAHAWNIVEIDGLWYNLDCTWDDPVGGLGGKESYSYFLKSDRGFKDHKRDEEYDTDEFRMRYRMSIENYKKPKKSQKEN